MEMLVPLNTSRTYSSTLGGAIRSGSLPPMSLRKVCQYFSLNKRSYYLSNNKKQNELL